MSLDFYFLDWVLGGKLSMGLFGVDLSNTMRGIAILNFSRDTPRDVRASPIYNKRSYAGLDQNIPSDYISASFRRWGVFSPNGYGIELHACFIVAVK
jgi:hypothetical protein